MKCINVLFPPLDWRLPHLDNVQGRGTGWGVQRWAGPREPTQLRDDLRQGRAVDFVTPALNLPLLRSPSLSNWPGRLWSLLQQPDLSAQTVFWKEAIDYGLAPLLSPPCLETSVSWYGAKQTRWMGINNNHFFQHWGGSQNHSLSLSCKDEPHFIWGISWGKPSSTVKHCIFLLLSLLPRFHGCFLLSFIQLKGGSKGPR